jgi:hypothetical protein
MELSSYRGVRRDVVGDIKGFYIVPLDEVCVVKNVFWI